MSIRGAKAMRVLHFIGLHENRGASFSEIQEFICVMNGKDWDARDRHGMRRYRGYWCDYLTGPGGPYNGSKGLLHRFCIQHPVNKRWILTEQIKGPFAGENMPQTKTQKHNLALYKGYQKMYEDALPKCTHCQQKVRPYPGNAGKEWAPDGLAHMTSWHSGGAETDCRKRVWYKGQLTTAAINEYEAIRDAVYKRENNFEFASHTAEMWLRGKVLV
jgi:hypothetical protein